MAQVDERAMAAREVTALRTSGSPTTSGHNSPTAAAPLAGGSREFAEALLENGGGGGLVRQGSMNLPKPEDSGVPATHPDMCILRIRRQHLLEVCLAGMACAFALYLTAQGLRQSLDLPEGFHKKSWAIPCSRGMLLSRPSLCGFAPDAYLVF